jgi:hypothetical protein
MPLFLLIFANPTSGPAGNEYAFTIAGTTSAYVSALVEFFVGVCGIAPVFVVVEPVLVFAIAPVTAPVPIDPVPVVGASALGIVNNFVILPGMLMRTFCQLLDPKKARPNHAIITKAKSLESPDPHVFLIPWTTLERIQYTKPAVINANATLSN